MYADVATVDNATLYQGDIIDGFPFYILDKGQPIEKNGDNSFIQSVEDESLLHAIELKKTRVMILSQSCDVQRRKNVMICPVYELGQFTGDNTLNKDSVTAIRDRKNFHLFYLPAYGSLPEAIADLQAITYVPRTSLTANVAKRIISMSDLGRQHLCWSLVNLFGRPAI